VPVQTSTRQRLAALRTESMTMTAFQLEEVELTPVLGDGNFARQLAEAKEKPLRANESTRFDPTVSLRGPEGAANRATLDRVVAEITGGQPLPATDFARRAIDWLQRRHAYALAVKLPAGTTGQDDIVRWLDSNEPGFCEYFAAGFTVLARAAGHPARVIAGFRGGKLNGFENYFMVKNSDAHAWAEIYDGAAAWLRVDPTPGAVPFATAPVAAVAAQVQDSSWPARMDSLRVLWYRRIVSFDSRTQVQMIEQVKSFTTDTGTALRARFAVWTDRLRLWIARPWNAGRIFRTAALGLGAGVLILAFVWLARWAGQRWRRWRRPHEFDPVRRAAGAQLVRLRELAGTPMSEDGAQAVAAVVADLQRLRYGPRETWAEPQAVFKRAKRARRRARG
jgi:hypothetical protein